MTFTTCNTCGQFRCACPPVVYTIRKAIEFLRRVLVGRSPIELAESKERKQFIRDHAHELGKEYAAEFWDKYN